MKVHTMPVLPIAQVTQEPFIRLIADGTGSQNDSGSPPFFLSVSDGKTVFAIELTEQEAKALQLRARVEITPQKIGRL